jgi:Sec-independent protein translocase protein TatA
MPGLLAPLLVFAACYVWVRYASGAQRERGRLLQMLGWGIGLAALMFFAVRSGQLLLAAVVALVLVGLRALPGLAGGAASGRGPAKVGANSTARKPARMSRSEALQVFDLEEGSSSEQINARYRVLIKAVHPDLGGSSYLASQLNAARQVLLGDE